MALPKPIPHKLRTIAITFRATEATYALLEALAKAHGLSQADVLEALIEQEAHADKR